jgi:hypothetical protein
LAFVAFTVPVTSDPTAPLALTVSFALVFARLPVTVVVPLALLVSLALVLANDPVTVVEPLAADVSLAFVLASDPVTVVVPDAALVSLAFVVAREPDAPEDEAIHTFLDGALNTTSPPLSCSDLISATDNFPANA